jgi:hypothetical protein
MEHSRLRKPSLAQRKRAGPGKSMLLAPAAKCAPPQSQQSIPEHREAFEVSWHRIVVEVALHDRFEPFASLGHGIVHAPVELLLDLSQLRSHALADRCASHCESPDPVLPTDMLEAQEIERLGFVFSSTFPVFFGKPPELDPARLFWMQLQSKLFQSFP